MIARALTGKIAIEDRKQIIEGNDGSIELHAQLTAIVLRLLEEGTEVTRILTIVTEAIANSFGARKASKAA